jgi:hypothetical protein
VGVSFSPDGRRLAVASLSDRTSLYDVGTREMALDLLKPGSRQGGWLTFSKEGRRLIEANRSGEVFLWEAVPW